MLRNQFNINMGIKMASKGIGLVAAQLMIEANGRMINGMPCILYIHPHKRAGVRACGRAGVQACAKLDFNVDY